MPRDAPVLTNPSRRGPSRAPKPIPPIPGMVTAVSISVGSKVAKGSKLVTLEAMNMQTTIYAQRDGVVAELLVAVGDPLKPAICW